LVLGFSAGIAPGPLLTLVITQSLSHGIAEGIKVAVAPLITDLPIIFAALALGSRLAEAPFFLGLLSLVGAGYLSFLARENMTVKPVVPGETARVPRSVARGVMANLLNPHPYLFWIAVGTPLLHKAWAAGPPMAILWLAGFYAMLVGTKIALAVLVGRWRRLLQGGWYLWANRILGGVLLFFAAVLVHDGWRLISG
jgi:threonine/homoserine/homoserine lactone efflux protein